jgi:hypothetical protein
MLDSGTPGEPEGYEFVIFLPLIVAAIDRRAGDISKYFKNEVSENFVKPSPWRMWSYLRKASFGASSGESRYDADGR